ncbi:MAG: NADPH-dependent assimilatory sulfite reductase hemoprotein subunit [Candidatus Omnitrophica bacterium]|nr:NADPH-dependent assimilatory sulfite reductase hemoprotein subunit [Candidatus Omnitrophota bacterium]
MSTQQDKTPFEQMKEASRFLRGTIRQTLSQDTPQFSADESQLLKFHGCYQQDDRDLRQQLLKEKKDKAFSLMVRSKIPAGWMNAEQYLAHDELAEKYGNGTLRITTRQGFQFHGVLKKNARAVIQGIHLKLGTTQGACGDVVRNVMADPGLFFDPATKPLFSKIKELSDHFLSRCRAYHEIWLNDEKIENPDLAQEDEPIYGKAYLPRKFKIAMASPDNNSIDVYSHDLGIIPEVTDGQLKGFNILVGGGFGMTHGIQTTYPRLATPFCFVSYDDLIRLVEAVVLVQRDNGNRTDRKHARLKYLIDSKGMDWFRVEVEKRFGQSVEPAHKISLKGIDYGHGWRLQADGRWILGVFVENGRIKDEGGFRLKTGLRALVGKYRPEIYLTACQDLWLVGIEDKDKPDVEDMLKNYGVTLPDEITQIRKNSMACPALPTCGLAISEAERALPAVMDELEKVLLDCGLDGQQIITRMTGCPNGCARPYNAEIALVGKSAGTYNIYLGGSLRGDRLVFLFAEKIQPGDIAKALRPIFESYQKQRLAQEGFGDFCDRMGADQLTALLPTCFSA